MRITLSLLVTSLFWLGCQSEPAPKTPELNKPIALDVLLKSMQVELNQMQKIYNLRSQSGRLLATMNAKLQSRGFSRRIPSGPAVQALESDLRNHARHLGLNSLGWKVNVPSLPTLPKSGVEVAPTERWKLKASDVRGVVNAELIVEGERSKLVAFIDDLPKRVERAVLVTGHRKQGNATVLLLRSFYERHHPAPTLNLKWPSLEQRLIAAGYKGQSAALQKSPHWADLVERDRQGRARIPSLRTMMLVAHDFPRWFAKAELFDQISKAIMAVKGTRLLNQPPTSNPG